MTGKKRYFISGGGTGGHIYPAVAVMNALKDENTEIFYMGNPENMEFEILKGYPDIKFLPVRVKGFPRKFGFDLIKKLLLLEVALWKSLYYFLKYKPDTVFATGGYVSAPAAFIAILLKKPLMLHDCDACPGIVSRVCAPFANCVSVAFESAKNMLETKKVIYTGNPVRKEFLTVSQKEAREKLGLRDKTTVLITGGSQGAKTLNKAAIKIAQEFVEQKDIQLVIQTGKKNYDKFVKDLTEFFPNWRMNTNLVVRPYFNEMYYALKSADITVSRAGSLSISELKMCKAACILVPYPYAAANHQFKNAKAAVDEGYAILIEDKDLTGEKLSQTLTGILKNPHKLYKMRENAEKFAKPDATEKITEILKQIAK